MIIPMNRTLIRYLLSAPLPLFFYVPVIAILILILTKKSKLSKNKAHALPPGPPSWPVIGNIPEMLLNGPTFRWIHAVMKEMETEIACFRFGQFHVIPVTSDKIAREVLREKDSVFAARPESFASKTLSGGYKTAVLTPYGDQWKKMRKILVSELNTPARLLWLHDRRAEEADSLLAYVRNLYKISKHVNVREVARHYCHSVTLRLMFGKRYFGEATVDGGPGAMELEHVEAIFTALNYLYAFCLSDYVPLLRGLDLDGHEKLVTEASETIDKCHQPIIDERIQLWRNHGGKKEVEDWLDILITLKDADGAPSLTPEEIKAQCKEIILAAVDNPSNNIEWTLAEMLNQSEILNKAIDELDNVVGKGRLVQESDIPKLNYIKACSREAYRLHPVGPFLVPHVALADTSLAGYFIPKGSHVHISRVELGRNPKIWDEPNKFMPERHLEVDGSVAEVMLTEPAMRFVSFSTGRRGCIADKLGTYMTVMLLARLLQGFTWSLPINDDEDCPMQVDLTEAAHDLLMAKPLVACVKPRLSSDLYPQIRN